MFLVHPTLHAQHRLPSRYYICMDVLKGTTRTMTTIRLCFIPLEEMQLCEFQGSHSVPTCAMRAAQLLSITSLNRPFIIATISASCHNPSHFQTWSGADQVLFLSLFQLRLFALKATDCTKWLQGLNLSALDCQGLLRSGAMQSL